MVIDIGDNLLLILNKELDEISKLQYQGEKANNLLSFSNILIEIIKNRE